MVLFNYAIREVTAKLVYYGPGLCGKTTNLQFIHEKLDPSARGKLLSLATDGDRTLFFDFLPIEMGSIGGYKVRFQLYTVPGQVHYNATRKLVLKGVDAVAFVADSQVSMIERNRESFANLLENLIENGYDPAKVPIVIQFNKRDLPNIASVAELVSTMGVQGYPTTEAVASRGDGVFETLKTIVKLTLSRLSSQFDTGAPGGTERRQAPPPTAPAPAPAAAPPRQPPAPPSLPVMAPALSPPPTPPPLPVMAPAPPPAFLAAAAPADGLDEFDLEYFSEDPSAPAAAAGPEAVFGEALPEEHDVVELGADMETHFDEQFEDGAGAPDTAAAGSENFEEFNLEEEPPAEATPAEAIPVEETPMEGTPVEAMPIEAMPMEALPAEAPVEEIPVEVIPMEEIPMEEIAAPGSEPAAAGEEEWPVEPSPEFAVAPMEEIAAGEPPPWAVEMMEELQRLRAENNGLREALQGVKGLLDRQIGLLREGSEDLERNLGDFPGERSS